MSAISSFPIAPTPAEWGGWRFGKECNVDKGDWSIEWILKRNCSMAPRQLFALFAGLCALSLSIAGFFWFQGAKLVMPFAWLELIAVGVALLAFSRHAADEERIALSQGSLMVSSTFGSVVEAVQFFPDWVHVEPVMGDGSLIELSGQGQRIEVGRFLRPELRKQLASELRRGVRVARGRQHWAV